MTNVLTHPMADAQARRDALEHELGQLDPWDKARLIWLLEAREKQLEPPPGWLIWMLLSGRGFGKTRVGAEDVNDFCYTHPGARYAIIAPTFAVGRDVCIEGESGVLAHAPQQLGENGWNRSEGRLTYPNGSQAKIFSSEKPDRLRGYQYHRAWFEELAAFTRLRATWDQAMFSLRLPQFGTPQALITTTPRPLKILRELVRRDTVRVTTGNTFENAANLSAVTLDELRRRYGGSRLGQQELDGVILDDVVGALWNGEMVASTRLGEEEIEPEYLLTASGCEVAVAVDPSVAAAGSEHMDETGIIAGARVTHCPCGRASRREPHVLILADGSLRDGPVAWGRAAVRTARAYNARIIFGEVNNGGDLVRLNIMAAWNATADDTRRPPRYEAVHASRGKKMRAEPVATLYDQGRVHHVGSLVELEHQMCTWVPPQKNDDDEYEPGELNDLGEDAFTGSPDRVDALVWLVTGLILDDRRPKRGGLVFVE